MKLPLFTYDVLGVSDMSFVLSICMLMSLMPVSLMAETTKVRFTIRNSNPVTVTIRYHFGDSGEFVTLGSEGEINVPEGAIVIAAKATPGVSENNSLYFVHEGNSGIYSGNKRVLSFSVSALEGGTYSLTYALADYVPEIIIEFDNNPKASSRSDLYAELRNANSISEGNFYYAHGSAGVMFKRGGNNGDGAYNGSDSRIDLASDEGLKIILNADNGYCTDILICNEMFSI